jgi:probable FeS assembly SUF system protein SufT
MNDPEFVILLRDCEASLIPSGVKTLIPAATEVRITQSLGGAYTVLFDGGMARIENRDADALGKEVQASPSAVPDSQPLSPEAMEQRIWAQMRTCYDPEIPVNIVDLGLVYDTALTPQPDGGAKVEIKMTLTAPGCGMGATIAADVENKIRAVPGVGDVVVALVWDPPWNQAMMTEAAKLQLGLM